MNLLLCVLLAAVLRIRPWRWLGTGNRLHAFAGATIACMLLWSISGKLGNAPSFHLLGTTVLTLMFGPPLALLAVMIAVAGVTAAGHAIASSFSLSVLLMGAVPVAASYLVYRLVDRRLPNHFFVYVFVGAFVNGALAMIASRLVTAAMLWFGSSADPGLLPYDYLLASVLLAWGEALFTGMMMTVLVVYRPEWVRLFDDSRYLAGR